jgi:SAM-dependent methyltransferase
MATAKFIVGDVLDVLRSLPDASCDLVLSSPPFLALRSYLPAGHPMKAKEMGSEKTPGEFIDGLLDVVEECRRVLAPHGSLCFELGDSYAGSGGAGGDYAEGGLRDGQPAFDGSARRGRARVHGEGHTASIPARRVGSVAYSVANGGAGWPLDKSLCLTPELLRLSMTYGFNPLTGRETKRWRVRNVVRWCRPNPPVGALADKVRPATTDMLVACTSRKRYFDLDAVRTAAQVQIGRVVNGNNMKGSDEGSMRFAQRVDSNPNGAPPLDHWWHDDVYEQDAWHIATEPFKGAHYATWPTELCVKPIEAMCPRRVCTVCGKPSARIVGDVEYVGRTTKPAIRHFDSERKAEGVNDWRSNGDRTAHRVAPTVGWSDCGHNSWRAGVVLDPFCGSGTTLAVATGHSRDAIGIDLDARNADLARNRVGMLLDVVETLPAAGGSDGS